ncbi:hypothetical protein SAMN02910453_0980 [Lachnospiraceae bacterium A10]|jgi:ElaB/YqjD/DUF883 family membrane-anchored ribosome-binding protein|nr:hypothetical protein SAMN02910453_0980 [Lachnospiraceae bacterium A10]
MEFDKRHEIEKLKMEIDDIELKEKQLRDELERLSAKKTELLRQIAEKSDEKYEQDMLELVYQQRKNLK